MPNFNKVFLMGNLTRDIELRHTPSNMAVATGALAINRKYKTKDGQQGEETCFVDFEAWGRVGEVMSEYLSKGDPVFIEGRLKLDQWQDKEGNNRQKMKVVVENMQFISTKGDGGSSGGQAQQQQSQSKSEPIGEDDIPF